MLKNFKERAQKIKEDIDSLHHDTYKVVSFVHDEQEFFVIASYNLNTFEYEIAVTNSDMVEIKLLSELPHGIFRVVADVLENVVKLPAGGKVTPMSVADVARRFDEMHTGEKDVEAFGLR